MLREFLLGSGGVIITALSILGGRLIARSARAATRQDREYQFAASYRTAAEQHLGWDFMMLGRLQRVEHRLGIDDPIPPPPPLFPHQGSDRKPSPERN